MFFFPPVLCFATIFYTVNKSCEFSEQWFCGSGSFLDEVILKKNKPPAPPFCVLVENTPRLAAVPDLSLPPRLWPDLLPRSSQLGVPFALADSLCKTYKTWPSLSICSAKSLAAHGISYCNIRFIPHGHEKGNLALTVSVESSAVDGLPPQYSHHLLSSSTGFPSPASLASHTSSLLKPFMAHFCFAITSSPHLLSLRSTADATFHPSPTPFTKQASGFTVSHYKKKISIDVGKDNWLTSPKSL